MGKTQAAIAATALEFMEQNPSFAQTDANVKALAAYMLKNKIEPTLAGFNAAWKQVREKPDEEPAKPAKADADAERELDRQIEAMSSDEFRKRVNSDKEFAAAVNAPRKKKS